jgi:hypothetical protein
MIRTACDGDRRHDLRDFLSVEEVLEIWEMVKKVEPYAWRGEGLR